MLEALCETQCHISTGWLNQTMEQHTKQTFAAKNARFMTLSELWVLILLDLISDEMQIFKARAIPLIRTSKICLFWQQDLRFC